MADDPNLRGGQDRQRINLSQEHEVAYLDEEVGHHPRAACRRGAEGRLHGLGHRPELKKSS